MYNVERRPIYQNVQRPT